MQFFEFLVVGVAAGWIMGRIRRGEGYGLIGNLVVGAIGSFIGWFLMGFMKVQEPNVFTQIGMAVMGAVVFFLALNLLRFKKKKKSDEEDD